ncbi:DNA alkylation repair protein [Natrarchaeobius sp. A-rgal3]|uniref:DNA alkylation repair protein n=1 Tax=Natrarchaeobius versutus TaxID=1679078 RepID=UPI003510CCD1
MNEQKTMDQDLNSCGLPEIRELADRYYRDHGWEDIETLEATDPDEAAFKVEAWARKAVAEDELPERLDYLEEVSRSESWRVRERVAMALKYANAHSFEQVEQTWYEWVEHDDNYVRRACEVGLMGVSANHVDPALQILDHLVSDSNDYVQKSCGGFAVSFVANKDPAVGRTYLDRWIDSENVRTRWNVAKAIGGAYGRENEHALTLAYRLSDDDEYRVRRAVASSLRSLFEKDAAVRERVDQWDDREEFRTTL